MLLVYGTHTCSSLNRAEILQKLEPTDAELTQRQQLLHKIDALVKKEWPCM